MPPIAKDRIERAARIYASNPRRRLGLGHCPRAASAASAAATALRRPKRASAVSAASGSRIISSDTTDSPRPTGTNKEAILCRVSTKSYSSATWGLIPRRALPQRRSGRQLQLGHQRVVERQKRAAPRAHRMAPHRPVAAPRRNRGSIPKKGQQGLYRGQAANALLGRSAGAQAPDHRNRRQHHENARCRASR